MDIAKYFISVGFKIEKKEISAMDKALKNVEAGLKKTTVSTEKATVAEKAVTKAKKATVKVVDEQALALKAAAKAEAEWIKKAREGQRVSNAIFKSKMDARKIEMAAMKRYHAEAIKMDRAFNRNKPTFSAVRKPPKIFGGAGARTPSGVLSGRLAHLDPDKSNSALSSMRSYYQQQERAALSSIKKQNAEIVAGVKMKEKAEEKAAAAERARRRELITENNRNLSQQRALERAERVRNNKASRQAEANQRRMERGSPYAALGLSMRAFAPAAALYGGYAGTAALYGANKTAVSNRNFITNVSGTAGASEQANQAAGKQSYDYLYAESNRLGLNAKEQAEPYGKLLAAAQASGATLPQAQKMFSQLSEHGATMHLDAVGQKRMVKALGDVFSKGQVYAEELKGQMGDASPTFPSYVAQAWAEKTKSGLTGAKAMGALQKDMSNSKVSSDIMYRALEIASEKAQPSLARSTSTSQAEENRVRNIASYSLNEASINGLEDGFYRMNRAIRVFAEDLAPLSESMASSFGKIIGENADFLVALRGMVKSDNPESFKKSSDQAFSNVEGVSKFSMPLAGLMTAAKAAQLRWQGIPAQQMTPEYQPFSSPYTLKGSGGYQDYKSDAMSRAFQSGGSKSSTVMISPGAFTINTMATNAEQLKSDLEPIVTTIFEQRQERSFRETMGQFSYKE